MSELELGKLLADAVKELIKLLPVWFALVLGYWMGRR